MTSFCAICHISKKILNIGYFFWLLSTTFPQILLKTFFLIFLLFSPGLFTSRDCCSGEATAHEAVVVIYCEWAATKPMR